MADDFDVSERRTKQRFIATRRGETCFWAKIGDQRVPLIDLSVDGFSMPLAARPQGEAFAFVLQRDSVPDEIRGEARVVNELPSDDGGLAGCRFLALAGDGRERLEDWLTAHVLASATVRITEKDAVAIVSGPSLV